MNITVTSSLTGGKISAVQSKSDAHRALICAALCDRTDGTEENTKTEITIGRTNADIDATAKCLTALGAGVERGDSGFTVRGGFKNKNGTVLDCGESGSTLRFLLPVAAVLGTETKFTGGGKLPLRPMLPLTEELRKKGSSISSDFLPITVKGKARGGRYVLPGNISSQFVSGLLMALPLTGVKCEILLSSELESKLYADMTLKTLGEFGIRWKKLSESETPGFCGGYVHEGGGYVSPGKYTVEGDWSGAAFFAVLAALPESRPRTEITGSGDDTAEAESKTEIYGLSRNSLQPDREIEKIISDAGALCGFENGVFYVKKGCVKPFSLDVSQFPDLFPVLAVLACAAKGESLLYNAGRLRIKESDRIASVYEMITSLGGKAEAGWDYLRVSGTGALKGGKVCGAGDHRIVMSAAIASALCGTPVEITGAEAVEKSYPDFFEDFVKCGGKIIAETDR